MHSSTAKHSDQSAHDTTEHDDEFRFLAGDAARVARTAPLPEVERVRIPLSSGRAASALAFAPGLDPELVLLHGAGLNAHGFDPTLLALDRPALAIDLPGHGRSDWRDDADYRPETLAPDVAEILDACTRTPVTLVGHSLGALTAALVAAARPDLVAGLVLIDLTPGIVPRRDASSVQEFITGQRDFAALEDMVERAIRFGIGTDREALTRGVALNTRRRTDGRWEWAHHFAHLDRLPSSAPRDPGEARMTDAAGEAGGPQDTADDSRTTPNTATSETPATNASAPDPSRPYAALWEVLTGLDIPVTLIRADRGMVDEVAAAEWRDRLPKAGIVTIAGPHNLHEAAPTALAAELETILPPLSAR